MKINRMSSYLMIFSLLILFYTAANALGQTAGIQTTDLTLYRDGLIHCEQEAILDAYLPDIILPLISEEPYNILLLDENLTTIDFNIEDKKLIAYSFGAKRLYIQYDTIRLTSKENEVWTLNIDYQHNINLHLPTNSTIIYLSAVPESIETNQENTITLSLPAGNWEISYILPTIVPPTNTPNNTNDPEQPSIRINNEYIILIAITAATIATLTLVLAIRKRTPKINKILKENIHLGDDDQAVVQFLIEKNGKAFEAELREKFPNIPRTSLWRLVRRLERLDIVEIKRIGLENQVQLKK